jgi:hypothetical protein
MLKTKAKKKAMNPRLSRAGIWIGDCIIPMKPPWLAVKTNVKQENIIV